MPRIVTAELDLGIGGSVDLVFSIAVASSVPRQSEHLSFTLDGRELPVTELIDRSGSRLHRVAGERGSLLVRYWAEIDGRETIPETTPVELIEYLRPSRYCQSDELFSQARRLFSGLHGAELVHAVTRYVEESVTYTPGVSLGTDSAVTTLTTGRGVCRDYAHIVIALLRAMDVPARYVSCYAPDLDPMDFHAVAEVYLDGAWHVVDATRLAPRGSLVRIATGRDAADCAFLDFHGAHVGLDRMRVDATDSDVAADDPLALVRLS